MMCYITVLFSHQSIVPDGDLNCKMETRNLLKSNYLQTEFLEYFAIELDC